MVQLPPLSEGEYSQVRAALRDRAATMERRQRIAEIRLELDPGVAEELDNITTALFWLNHAILTVARSEPEAEPQTWTTA